MAYCDNPEICCLINFKGWLERETYGKMTVEFLKYALYLRGQIPCLFDQARSILQTNKESKVKNEGIPRIHLNKERRQKQIDNSLATFDLLFKHIKEAFTEVPVSEAVFSMGATLASPKELYILTFPSISECSKCKGNIPLNQQSCMQKFFRTITSADVISSKGNFSLMKISVLLKIPRKCTLSDYMNIRSYKFPKKVKKIVVQLNSMFCSHQIAQDNEEDSMQEASFPHSQSDEMLVKQLECLKVESIARENPYCWVQVLPVASGFKDTVTSCSQEDIWI